MKPERWQQIESLCHSALKIEPGRRDAFLQKACAGDDSLRRQVDELLAHDGSARGLMNGPAMQLAARQLAQDQETPSANDLIGRTIGRYRVVAKIGEGGMGEVFLAEDATLQRKVALKFLPPAMQRDPLARKRFLREAQSAAALDHPYICHINEVGESEGRDFIAMEYVPGQMLSDRLESGPIPVRDALQNASEVAEALEEAHDKGIIHRDLKPANIMLTRKGHAKVMDFGLAKQLIPRTDGQEETMTESGAILGTLAYMSPEQLRGEPVDVRSDIFSLGVVLYEILSGTHPFRKHGGLDTAAEILHSAPRSIADLRPDIPADLDRVVLRMLAKAPSDRYTSVGDVQVALKNILTTLDREIGQAVTLGAVAQTFPEAIKALHPYREWKWILAGLLLFLLVGTGIVWYLSRPPLPSQEIQLTPIPLTSYPGSESGASFAPDGSQVAFAWNGGKEDNWDIYVKLIGSEQALRLTTNPAPDTWPAWSPDGRQIAFCRDLGAGKRAVVLVSPLGGPERVLTECRFADDNVTGPFLSWSSDGRAIAMVDQAGDHTDLVLYMMETGEKQFLTKPRPNGFARDSCPVFSPDGRTLSFCRWISWANADLYVLDFSQDLKPVGEPRRLTFQNLAASGVTWVPDGSALVYSTGGNLWRVAASGSSQPHMMASIGQDAYFPAISTRGARLAYTSTASDPDIWHVEISSSEGKMNPPIRFLSSTRFDGAPRFSPDGNRIAFSSRRSGSLEIWACYADGSNAIQLTHFGKGETFGGGWSPDGSRLVLDSNSEGHPEVYAMNAGGGSPRRLTFSSGSENPSWSKDGRWIYFNSLESGIQKVPADGGPVVSVNRHPPGYAPVESPDGKFLFITGKGTDASNLGLWRVPVEGGESRQVLGSLLAFNTYDPKQDGIYFIPRPDPATGHAIRFLDFATGKIKTIAELGELGKNLGFGLTVSPDRRWALYALDNQTGSDLMLVENFR